MCGFVAEFSAKGGVKAQTLAQGLKTLHHRGPDGQKHWLSPDGRVGLGHARLSIIDLSTGDQPIATQDGDLHIIHNGEFYGFEAIRRQLQAEGHVFRTQSDSEIALHLYRKYGTECLSHLRGEFAFVIWDARNRTFFAARDRFGIKPMFYAFHNDRIVMASEVKALFAMGVPAAWDDEAVYLMHSGRLTPPGRSLYRGIGQIPPGQFLIATPEHRRFVSYWDFDYPEADSPDLIRDPEEALSSFKDTFEESVRLRLRADVPVACYLSGGLDSCSILGVANRMSEKPVHAFTLSFEAGHYDESVVAEEMARHSGAPYHQVNVRPQDLADNFKKALWNAETPFMNAHGVAKFMLSRAVRDAGFKVVMTGEGSDEILGGYIHFRRDWLLYNSTITDPKEREQRLKLLHDTNVVSRPIMSVQEGPNPTVEGIRSLLGFVPSFLQAGSRTVVMEALSQKYHETFKHTEPMRLFFNEIDVRRQLLGREPVNQSLYLWSKTMLPNYLLSVLGDRMEMAHSVEGRVPFLDHKLVELMTRIPVSEKIKDMREKHLLREAAKYVLTDTVYRREKHPFMAPPAASAKDDTLHTFIQDTLRGDAMGLSPFYDKAEVAKLLDRSANGDDDTKAMLDPALMQMTSFVLLQQELKLEA